MINCSANYQAEDHSESSLQLTLALKKSCSINPCNRPGFVDAWLKVPGREPEWSWHNPLKTFLPPFQTKRKSIKNYLIRVCYIRKLVSSHQKFWSNSWNVLNFALKMLMYLFVSWSWHGWPLWGINTPQRGNYILVNNHVYAKNIPYIFSATGSQNFKYGKLWPLVPLAMTNISLKILTASKSLAKIIDVSNSHSLCQALGDCRRANVCIFLIVASNRPLSGPLPKTTVFFLVKMSKH